MTQPLNSKTSDGVLTLTSTTTGDNSVAADPSWITLISALSTEISNVASGTTAVVIDGGEALNFRSLEVQKAGFSEADMQAADQLIATIGACDIPVVAAMNGPVNDFGWQLALCCDYRIATESAVYMLDLLKQGSIPGFGGSQRLHRLVGMKLASKLLTTPHAMRLGVSSGRFDCGVCALAFQPFCLVLLHPLRYSAD